MQGAWQGRFSPPGAAVGPRAVGNGGADQVAEPRELQQYEEHNHHEGDKGQQQQCSLSRHTFLLNHPGPWFGHEATVNRL